MKTGLLVLMLAICQIGICQFDTETTTAIREYSDSTGFFIIEYTYSPGGICMIPATNPPGQPHYPCSVEVYKIINGKKVLVGERFEAQYTRNGCFEDDPAYMVSEAKRLTPELLNNK